MFVNVFAWRWGNQQPGKPLHYFWDGCPFPPEGLIEEPWLSPSHPAPPRSDSGSQAKHGSAGLTDCSHSRSTKPAGPVACARPSTHSTTLHCPQMAAPPTWNHHHWCSASVWGGSTLLWKAALRLCGRSPCSCFCSKLILMMRHRLTIHSSSYLIPKILGWILFSVWSDQAPRKPHGINLGADVSGWRVWLSTFSLGWLIGWVYVVGV